MNAMLKQSLRAMLLLGTGAAHAQTAVTVYGVVDAGIVSVNNQRAASGETGKVTGLSSGGISPSIFGFKGSEDLGGGMKANFNLEGHFFSNSGVGNQWGGIFGRQANVGFSSSLGTIALGKQYSPAVLAYGSTDPRGLKETFSGLLSWALTQNPLNVGNAAAPANSTSVADIFVANAISVGTKVGNLNLAGSYSLGEVAGSGAENRTITFGATYTGPLTLSAAYQADNGRKTATAGGSGVQTRKYSVGAGYTLGNATLTANYLDNENTNPANDVSLARYHITGLGVNYRTAPNNAATLAFYYSKNKEGSGDNSKTLILSDDYSLSKRTTLYALVAGVKAGAGYTSGSPFGVANDKVLLAAVDKTTTAIQIGVKHSF